MRKKTLLVSAMSMALVGVIAVGGTLAYLHATAGPVTNTFTFAGGQDGTGLSVALTEALPATPKEQESYSKNETGGIDYANIVPGQQLSKSPHFSVTASVDAYVFAKVEVGKYISLDSINSNWELMNTVTEGDMRTYYYVAEADIPESTTTETNPASLMKTVDLGNLFDSVTISDSVSYSNGDTSAQIGNIKIEVAAVQKQGYTKQDALALIHTNDTTENDSVFQA